ncbi:MAG: OmpH family outer membrane protein [Coxiellaceae bacterium]|nr:OmpH family outer membrane protein [Coxiellaceae bacterium]
MKKVSLLAASLLFCVGLTANAANTQVGIIDMHKVLSESPQVQKIKNDLQAQFKPQQEKLVKARDTLQADAENLNKNASIMSTSDRDALQKKVANEQRDLQQEQMAYQQQAMKAQNAAFQEFMKDVKGIASNVAKQQKLDMIMTTDNMVYFQDTMDITDKVIAKLKAQRS